MCSYEGREYSSDVARIINKFDVYICDLGDMEENAVSVGKKRPCVIVSSDRINNPKQNKYHVAPIRSEHNTKVTKETLEYIVQEKRKLGRIYVPIETSPDKYSFIDMSDTRPVSSSDILAYKYRIINIDLRKKINEALMEYYFNDNEIIGTEFIESSIKANSDTKDIKVTKYPTGFTKYAELYLKKKITQKQIAENLGVDPATVCRLIKSYRKQYGV